MSTIAQVQEKAKFDFIRYSNCWEDAAILLEALDTGKNKNIVSIASAGDNCLALLLTDPAQIVAVDMNLTQLACLELRIAAFKCLKYEDILKFLGVLNDNERYEKYKIIRQELSSLARDFWDQNPRFIQNGVIHQGKLERFFYIFRKYVLPLMQSKNTVKELLEQKDIEKQKDFYYRVWDNKRWRIIFGIFSGRPVTGKLGRDPEFYRYVQEDVSTSLTSRLEHCLTSIPAGHNPYLYGVFAGNFPVHALPLYLRRENYEKIKMNIAKISIYHGDLIECLKEYSHIKFDAFNMSDIFEYMSPEESRDTFKSIVDSSTKGARIAFWNMAVDRLVPEGLPVYPLKDLSYNLHQKDNVFFYKRFIVAEVM